MTAAEHADPIGRAEQQVTRLQEATSALAAARSTQEVGRVVVDRVLPMLRAAGGGLALLSADGTGLMAVHQAGDLPAGLFPACRDLGTAAEDDPVAIAVKQRRTVRATAAQDRPADVGQLRQQASAVLWVPLLLGDRVTGVLGVAFPGDRVPGEPDERLAEGLAVHAAQALERTRLQEQAAPAGAARLAANQARLEHLVSSSPAVTYCLEARPPYRLSFVSENVARVYGVTVAELFADPGLFSRRLHPDDRDAVAAGLDRLMDTGHEVQEYRFRRDDGSWGWTRDEQVVVRAEDGTPVEVVGSLLDITDRKRTEERAARLLQLTTRLAAALTPDQVVAGALMPALSVLEAEAVGLMLREPGADPPMLVVAGTAGYPAAAAEPWRRLPLDSSSPAGDAILSGTALYLRSAQEAQRRFPAMFGGPGPHARNAWAALPLRAGGEVVGALAVGFATSREFPPEERRFLETVAAQCALALERARLYDSAATERERLAAVLSRLPVGVVIAEAPSGRLVLGNTEVERIWRHPFVASPEIGGYVEYRGFHPADGRPYVPEEWPIARSLTTGEVVTGEEIDILRGDGSRGTMVVNAAPILDPDGSIGAAVCTFLDITDRAEARRRLGAAYAAEREARAAAEAAWARLDRLQQVTAGLSEAVTVKEVAAVMMRGGMSLFDCRSAWIGVLDEQGESLVALAASWPLTPDGPAARIPLDAASPRAEATRTGQPVWLSSTADALERYPGLRALGIKDGALGVVPLVSHGRPIGALMVDFVGERTFRPDEQSLVTTLADQCAQALERARLHEQAHNVALTLQHSMLPSALPEVAGLELTARYHPAVDSLEVGGDWYDVLALPDGRVALAVGDVVGRGLGAATTMGQLRSALAALALSAQAPAEVLDGLERFARQVEGARLATVAYAVLDPVAGTLRYACAGHPPPLVLQPDGSAVYLEGGRSPLLCALPPGIAGPRAEGGFALVPGARLLLFSDGLVERRRESLDVGLRRLAATAAETAAGGGPGWCDELVRRMLVGAGDDDVALLSMTYAPQLHRRLPALPERLAGLRRELRGWLAGIGTTADEAADVLLACGEAAANAVEHAYRDGPGEVDVRLQLTAGRELTVRVCDRGRWRRIPAPGDRGRGLPLMRVVMDAVDVEAGEDGTVITMRRRLAAPGPAETAP